MGYITLLIAKIVGEMKVVRTVVLQIVRSV